MEELLSGVTPEQKPLPKADRPMFVSPHPGETSMGPLPWPRGLVPAEAAKVLVYEAQQSHSSAWASASPPHWFF